MPCSQHMEQILAEMRYLEEQMLAADIGTGRGTEKPSFFQTQLTQISWYFKPIIPLVIIPCLQVLSSNNVRQTVMI